jgi:hypothetical protein
MTCARWMVALMLACAFGPAALAVSPQVLKAQCDAWLALEQTPAAAACESYLAGFIDGLRTEARLHMLPERESAESWSDRAARTRLSRTQWARVRHRRYCITAPVPMRDIVSSLVAQLDAAIERSDETAANAVESVLLQNYRCV